MQYGSAHRPTVRRGVALVLVTTVLAVAALLGFAMLSSAALQARASESVLLASSADSLAESGANVAGYYLLYPSRAPFVGAGGFWPGENNISLGSDVPGTVSVTVALVSPNLYDITSVGQRTTTGGELITRTVSTRLQINPGLQVQHGANFAGNTVLPPSVSVYGSVQAQGTLLNLGKIYGTAYALVLPLKSALALWTDRAVLTDATRAPIPTASTVRDYRSYVYQGQTYAAARLQNSTLANGTVLGPTSENPAGIYYRSGALTLGHNVRVNGTLLVDGVLTVQGQNANIMPLDGYPALVARSDVVVKGAGSNGLTANGISWLGGSLRSVNTTSAANVRFNGAVYFGGSSGVDSGFVGSVVIQFDAEQPMAPELHSGIAAPGVKTIWWR